MINRQKQQEQGDDKEHACAVPLRYPNVPIIPGPPGHRGKMSYFDYEPGKRITCVEIDSFCPHWPMNFCKGMAVSNGSTNNNDVAKWYRIHTEDTSDGTVPKHHITKSNNPDPMYHQCPRTKQHSVTVPCEGQQAKNVLLCEEETQAKLTNIDSARTLQDKWTKWSLRAMGTKGFVAPEVFIREHHGISADVYNMGRLFVEWTVGVPKPYTLPQQILAPIIKNGEIMLSGIRKINSSVEFTRDVTLQHSAYTQGSNWKLRVKCNQHGDSITGWNDLLEVFPNATFEEKPTCIVINIPPENISGPISFVVVGSCPGGFKRMQVIAYGTKPTSKNGCQIDAFLIDDNQNAVKVMHENEKKRGRCILGQPRLLHVANTEKPIEFFLQFRNNGWKLKDSDIKTLDSCQAFGFWERFPNLEHCSWTIEHADKSERHLRCSIFVTHGEKSTFLPIHEYLEEKFVFPAGKEEMRKEGKEELVYHEKYNNSIEKQKAQERTVPTSRQIPLEEVFLFIEPNTHACKWKELGLALAVPKGDLDLLCGAPETYPNMECATKMLLDWLTHRAGGEAEALLELERKAKTKQEALDLNKLEIQKEGKSRHSGHYDFITKTPVPPLI